MSQPTPRTTAVVDTVTPLPEVAGHGRVFGTHAALEEE
jgi:hypothetical protein